MPPGHIRAGDLITRALGPVSKGFVEQEQISCSSGSTLQVLKEAVGVYDLLSCGESGAPGDKGLAQERLRVVV